MTAAGGGKAARGTSAVTAPRAGGGSAWHDHLATAALVLLGVVLYARGIVLGYVGDDLTLLDAALRHPLGELLSGRHGILGYYRPVSRELYFWGWGRIAGLGPGGFHLVNALTFAAVVFMIERLGRSWGGARAGRLAAAAFVLFPPGSALLAWVSCAQDLIMLFWSLAALLLYRHGRPALAGIATLAAALSKETAVVLPLALAIMDARLHPRDGWTARLVRLGPAFTGLAAAVVLSIQVRATWPPGAAMRIWSPGQFAGAWRLPLDLARTLVPPDTGAGIAQAVSSQPVWLALAALCAALAVPAMARVPAAQARAPAAPPGGTRSLVVFGLVLLVLAMLPVGFVIERWRGYFFSLSAVGGALALGALLAPLAPAIPRALLAIAAMVNFGAGGIYRPIETKSGPARHPHVNYAFFRETATLSDDLLAALQPWCGSIRALPRTFVAGVPPDQVFETALGPGLRVTCADTVERVRFLADFTPADARADFGVLRFDPRTIRFMHERADARVRARVGEGFMLHARYDVAAACFDAAAGPAPDRELSYPLASSLAAAGRVEEARVVWQSAIARGAALHPDTMARRFSLAEPAGASTLRPLAAAALREPWLAEPHTALGQALLGLGRAREGTFELATAAGIGRGMAELARLGQGYEAMGLNEEAMLAYRRALESGLPADLYAATRDRFFALQRRTGAELDRPQGGP